jgi:soluble lytic murein transglycosylase-like protein
MLKITFTLLALLISDATRADYLYKVVNQRGSVLYTNKSSAAGDACKETAVYYSDEPNRGVCKLIKRKIKDAPMLKMAASGSRFSFAPRFSSARKSQFNDLIEQAAAKHQVDVRLVHAVIQTESAYNSNAISSAGAVGLMQLMPDTARRFGVMDSTAPDQNIDGGTRYLKHLINMFEPNLDLAVAAYNAGENAVIRHNNAIPPYPETQNYVRQVLALYNR